MRASGLGRAGARSRSGAGAGAKKPVELMRLQGKARSAGSDDAESCRRDRRPVECPPVDLDRFVGSVLIGERARQRERDLGVVGVEPHCARGGRRGLPRACPS